jgi:hypothetical protein
MVLAFAGDSTISKFLAIQSDIFLQIKHFFACWKVFNVERLESYGVLMFIRAIAKDRY